jgi:hypothetical protein
LPTLLFEGAVVEKDYWFIEVEVPDGLKTPKMKPTRYFFGSGNFK